MEVTSKMYTHLFNTTVDTLNELEELEKQLDEIEADFHKRLEYHRANIHGIKNRIKIAHTKSEKEFAQLGEPKGIPFSKAAKKPVKTKKDEPAR